MIARIEGHSLIIYLVSTCIIGFRINTRHNSNDARRPKNTAITLNHYNLVYGQIHSTNSMSVEDALDLMEKIGVTDDLINAFVELCQRIGWGDVMVNRNQIKML